MVAAIGKLEAIRLLSVNLRMGRVSTIGPRAMVAAVISELEARHFVYVNRRIGRMRSIVGLRGRRRQVIGRVLRRLVRSDGGEIDVRIGNHSGATDPVILELWTFSGTTLSSQIGGDHSLPASSVSLRAVRRMWMTGVM